MGILQELEDGMQRNIPRGDGLLHSVCYNTRMQKSNHRMILLCLVFITFCCWLPATFACGTGTTAVYLLARPTRQITDAQEISAEMDRIEVQVQTMTGLKPVHSVPRRLITRAELAARMKTEFEKNYSQTQARNDASSYAVFDLIPENADLYQIYLRMYSSSVAGFFDPETGDINVISDAGFGPEQMMTYAHEYMHALQFQRYSLAALRDHPEIENQDPERYIGLQAIVEGEASLVEDTWVNQQFTWLDRWDAVRQEIQSSLPEENSLSIPAPLWSFLFFPYDQGKSFVQTEYQNGGWQAMDAVFQNPPVSSEMILHPDRYQRADLPVQLSKPGLASTMASTEWAELDDSTWGEFGVRVILELHIAKEESEMAAAGWGGDRYIVWRNRITNQLRGVWHTAWDTIQDADEFDLTLMKWDLGRETGRADDHGFACWTNPRYAICQRQNGKDVWWAYASSTTDARLLLDANGQS
jgi:hypothetical protein